MYAMSDGNPGNKMISRVDNAGNDVILCTAWVTDVAMETTSCTAIAELSTTDSVRVTGDSHGPYGSARIRGGYSGFSGHLVEFA